MQSPGSRAGAMMSEAPRGRRPTGAPRARSASCTHAAAAAATAAAADACAGAPAASSTRSMRPRRKSAAAAARESACSWCARRHRERRAGSRRRHARGRGTPARRRSAGAGHQRAFPAGAHWRSAARRRYASVSPLGLKKKKTKKLAVHAYACADDGGEKRNFLFVSVLLPIAVNFALRSKTQSTSISCFFKIRSSSRVYCSQNGRGSWTGRRLGSGGPPRLGGSCEAESLAFCLRLPFRLSAADRVSGRAGHGRTRPDTPCARYINGQGSLAL